TEKSATAKPAAAKPAAKRATKPAAKPAAAAPASVELDLSDVDHRVGQLIGGGQLHDPCSSSDIRRWVMAMDYPNPLHWDEEFARNSRFGGLVAPQSIAVGLDYGHGAAPACVGYIPGSHLIFGGEEWWFYGARVHVGDKLYQERRFHDYKVAETKFAGPTMFSRGDTTHTNQHGSLVARERSTAIRYNAAEAEKRGMYENQLR
nr:MaoC family dehydratase N-terminal domain-containing protein [Micromonospora sp. DSM 115978]